ncbi:MAG: hypothetical protein WCQ50_20420 [Spirochaetota bacterium]
MFEKALAWDPNSTIVQVWRGRAYYRAGFEATALGAWETIAAKADVPPSLAAFMEALRARRTLPRSSGGMTFVEASRIEGGKGKSPYFLRPTTILPESDGTFFLVSHGSDQILRLNSGGVVKERLSGGLAGFDHPFGIVRGGDGALYISEFQGNRITSLGPRGSITFGARGRKEGQLLGPQYLAADDRGYIYVSDFGNARVTKFDSEGNFILAFGGPASGFPGLASPSGIACASGLVYVADSTGKCIFRFDESGNFLGTLAGGELHFPEGLAVGGEGRRLLVADTDRIVTIDLENERVDEVYRSPDKDPRITSAVYWDAGSILASDFDRSTVAILGEPVSLARGYRVEIDRIDASKFPKVELFVSVCEQDGSPVVGLDAANFHLSETVHAKTSSTVGERIETKTVESIIPVRKPQFEGSGNGGLGFATVLLIERSSAMARYGATARSLVSQIAGGLAAEGKLGLVLAGKAASLVSRPSNPPELAMISRAVLSSSDIEGRFDTGLRLAANTLMPSGIRDSIIYLSTGSIGEPAADGSAVSELGALLENNDIRFNVVLVGEGRLDPALQYLVTRSGGRIVNASGPNGLGDLALALGRTKSAKYKFSFDSADDAAFGSRQMTVSIEAYLNQKSGRDELGYYAPLE